MPLQKNTPPQVSNPSTLYPLPSPQTPEPAGDAFSSALRLAKVNNGVRVSWDGQRASNRQFELTKTCVDLRQPGSATTSTRIRLNTSEWVDEGTSGACAPGEAARYEVSEVGHA